MGKTHVEGPNMGLQVDAIELRKVEVNLGNAFVRLGAADRRKVLRSLEQLVYGNSETTSHWDLWTKDDVGRCYRKLLRISQEMADGWGRWAFTLLKTGNNTRQNMKCFVDELVWREWIEEP